MRFFVDQIFAYAQLLLCGYTNLMWKWIVHKVTGRCELLRILYDEQPGALRTLKTGECCHTLVSGRLRDGFVESAYRRPEPIVLGRAVSLAACIW